MKKTKLRVRPAIIAACTVEVLCPYCGGAQPNPANGGFPWDPDEVRDESEKNPKRNCTDCDAPFVLHARSTAQVDAGAHRIIYRLRK